MRKIGALLGALTLSTTLAGCWEQPGYNAGKANWNPHETELTSDNVTELTELWSYDTGDAGVTSPLSVGGKVFAFVPASGGLPHQAVALNAGTGDHVWTMENTQADLDQMSMGEAVHFDDTLYVPFMFAKIGSLLPIDAATGEASTVGFSDAVWTSAIARGALVTGYVTWGSQVPSPIGARLVTSQCSAALAGLSNGTAPVNKYAYFGMSLAWAKGTQAVLFRGCNEETGRYALETPVELGGTPTAIVAITDNTVGYLDQSGTLTVLHISTAGTEWVAEVGENAMAPTVADGKVFITTPDGHLRVLDAATGAPLWEAANAEVGGRPVAAGDVVYVQHTDGTSIAAYPVDGCGLATCPALHTFDVGSIITGGPIVDDGRVIVGTNDGEIVAFGLNT